MPIKIHHGAPGSFKTSGAMSDDIFPILESGRLIITNVRGFTRERVLENFPEFDDKKVKILNIDTEDHKKRLTFAKWFHWAPLGAFFLIDEAQMVFPKKWNQKFLESLDYGDNPDDARKAGRPHDWWTAWEMHRHYNWDFVLTTPNIRKIRTDIRECADGGFFHRDLGSIGLNGRYKEAFHSAIDNPSASTVLTTQSKKVNPNVFKLYKSTKTDEFSYTSAGIKIWKDPKLLVGFSFVAACLFYGFNGIANSKILNAVPKEIAQNHESGFGLDGQKPIEIDDSAEQIAGKNNDYRGRNGVDSTLNQGIHIVDYEKKYGRKKKKIKSTIPFSDDKIHMVGMMSGKNGIRSYYKIVSKNKTHINFSNKDFEQIGFKVIVLGECYVQLVFNKVSRRILCDAPIREKKQTKSNSIARNERQPSSNRTVKKKSATTIAGIGDEGGYRRARQKKSGLVY